MGFVAMYLQKDFEAQISHEWYHEIKMAKTYSP